MCTNAKRKAIEITYWRKNEDGVGAIALLVETIVDIVDIFVKDLLLNQCTARKNRVKQKSVIYIFQIDL